jgi:uncharacterized surface protein with fasciclin (FAS1) repeats
MFGLGAKQAMRMAGVVLLSLVLAVGSAAGQASNADIVDTAVAAGNFNTLVAAIKAAGLAETLRSVGPLTVFAPTDAAFAKLPKGTLESLLKPANRQKLVQILKLHVVRGRLSSGEVSRIPRANTMQGTDIMFAATPQGIRVDRAKVIRADVQAQNGVIHAIDQVLMPKDIVETAAVAGQFSTLLTAAQAAGLVRALKDPNANLTLFAPTDAAFAALPPGTLQSLLQPQNKSKLAAILKYHVLPRRLALTTRSIATLQGDSLQVLTGSPMMVGRANVILGDVKATNGVIQVIDRVLLPSEPAVPVPRAVVVQPASSRQAMGLIESAVQRGAPLFNAGKPKATVAIYEAAARSLLRDHSGALTAGDQKRLTNALANIRTESQPEKQAWILRHALDEVHGSLRMR